MTVLGKILVFINLVFSLIVGALVVVIFMTRTNWSIELGKAQTNRAIEQSNNQVIKQDYDKLVAERDTFLAQNTAEKKKIQDDLNNTLVREKDVSDKLIAEEKKSTKLDAAVQAALLEVKRRQEDVNKMRDTLNGEIDKNTRLVKEKAEQQQAMVQAQLGEKTAVERALRLEGQLQDLARDNPRLKAGGGVATASLPRGPGVKNPPSGSVEGLVRGVSGNMVSLTIGSDAGLQKGHTLDLFRLDRIPANSKWLGTVRIIDVRATEAVAEPDGT